MDALAALRCWPIHVELAGREFTIPPVPAADWFIAILGEKPLPIVPGMLPKEQEEEVAELIVNGEVDLKDLTQAARDALEVASGWRWWEADRLIRSAGAQWKIIGGELTRTGVDLHTQPLGAVLGTLYVLAVRNLDEQKRQQVDFQISRPPAELAEEEREAIAEQMFLDLLAEAGGPTG